MIAAAAEPRARSARRVSLLRSRVASARAHHPAAPSGRGGGRASFHEPAPCRVRHSQRAACDVRHAPLAAERAAASPATCAEWTRALYAVVGRCAFRSLVPGRRASSVQRGRPRDPAWRCGRRGWAQATRDRSKETRSGSAAAAITGSRSSPPPPVPRGDEPARLARASDQRPRDGARSSAARTCSSSVSALNGLARNTSRSSSPRSPESSPLA